MEHCQLQTPKHARGRRIQALRGLVLTGYTARVIHESTYDKLSLGQFTDVRQKVLAEIREQRKSCLSVVYEGPFVAGQMDMTTVDGEEYITFTVSYIPPGGATLHQIALATRAIPGSHTTTVENWLEQVRWNVRIHKKSRVL